MNQLVDPHALMSAIPLPAPKPPMTRYEKLMRWARIVREHRGHIALFHNLEHWEAERLAQPAFYLADSNAFALAMRDQVFADAGLKSEHRTLNGPTGSVGQVMKFMEITQQQVHAFSCDCGGAISNTDMADRIERLA